MNSPVGETPMQSSRPHARAICGAKTRSGAPCQNAPMTNGRCRMHGGKTPGGIALPHTKHGRYSKHLPGRLLERYKEALSDPDLIGLREEIGLIDSRLADLLSRVDTGESGRLWALVREAWARFKDAQSSGDRVALLEAVTELDRLISRATSDAGAWREIVDLVDQRRKLAESERKRQVEMRQVITAEQAMVLVAAIADTVRRNVRDRDAVAAIQADIARLTA